MAEGGIMDEEEEEELSGKRGFIEAIVDDSLAIEIDVDAEDEWIDEDEESAVEDEEVLDKHEVCKEKTVGKENCRPCKLMIRYERDAESGTRHAAMKPS